MIRNCQRSRMNMSSQPLQNVSRKASKKHNPTYAGEGDWGRWQSCDEAHLDYEFQIQIWELMSQSLIKKILNWTMIGNSCYWYQVCFIYRWCLGKKGMFKFVIYCCSEKKTEHYFLTLMMYLQEVIPTESG